MTNKVLNERLRNIELTQQILLLHSLLKRFHEIEDDDIKFRIYRGMFVMFRSLINRLYQSNWNYDSTTRLSE